MLPRKRALDPETPPSKVGKTGSLSSPGGGGVVHEEKTRIIVKKLDLSVDAAELGALLGPYGKIKTISIPVYQGTKKPKGFGYVKFFNGTEAETALAKLDGITFHGSAITLAWVRCFKCGGGHFTNECKTLHEQTKEELLQQSSLLSESLRNSSQTQSMAIESQDLAELERSATASATTSSDQASESTTPEVETKTGDSGEEHVRITDQSQEWIENAFDTKVVPYQQHILGRISKRQLTHGLSVLLHLRKILRSESPKKADIVHFTNEFYTVIPHSSGLQRLPLLDNLEVVEAKILTLEDLLQVY